MPLTSIDEQKIDNWNQSRPTPITIRLSIPESEADTAPPSASIESDFQSLAKQLTQKMDGVSIKPHRKDIPRAGFELADNLLFSAFPLQKELDPFLKAITWLGQIQTNPHTPLLSAAIQTKVEKIEVPVHLKLYVALFCPHCPKMMETLIPLALSNPAIRLEIVDGSLFEAEAAADQILSAPCLILDNDFRWTGAVSQDEIVDMIIDRDSSQLSMETLKTIMEQGEAGWIAGEMIAHNQIFASFIELICHATWSVRLGAMVIVEELVEKTPGLAETLCPLLMDQFSDQDISTQGDLLYALGEAGNTATLDWISGQMDRFTHPDLIDAAKEAIESLSDKQGTMGEE